MPWRFPSFRPACPLTYLAGCFLVFGLTSVLPRSAPADLFYRVQKVIRLTDSGLNPAADGTIPFSVTGLNDAGAFVGYFPSATANKLHAFLWDDARQQFLDLNNLLAADSSLATCLNAHGTVAGVFWELGTYTEKGFLYCADGTVRTFTSPDGAGGNVTAVTAMNAAGDVTGTYVAADGTTRGFLLQQPQTGGSPATLLDLGDLGQTGFLQYVWPNALNDLDQVVGNEYLLPPAGAQGVQYTQGFFWDAGMVLVDASDLSANWTALALNADGQVVGRYGLGSDPAAPFSVAGSFLWDGNTDTDLGSLGGRAGADAFAILDGGLAFGTSLAADGALHLFQAARPNNLSGFALADWGSVSLYAGDTSFLPVSLSAATVKLVSTTVTPDAVGRPAPHPADSSYCIAGFGTDVDGDTLSLLWTNNSIHSMTDLLPAYLAFTTISHA